MALHSRSRIYPVFIAGSVIAAVMAIVATFFISSVVNNSATVYFADAAGLYEGDPVTVRGVPVGTVDSIVPDGERVRVEVTYDADVALPADVGAAIVSPTLVTGRFVQFTPPYQGGDVLADGAVIDVDRTVNPVEFDEIKEQMAALAQALGPDGANTAGSVSRLADAGAAALTGRGADLNETLRSLADAGATLDRGSDDLFTAVDGFSRVVSALAASDRDVAGFATGLAGVSGTLADSRNDLAAVLEVLAPTMTEIQKFVDDNEQAFATETRNLTDTTGQLVGHIDDLAQLLHTAPTALSNIYNIYDRDANSVTGALMIADPVEPLGFLCGLALTVGAAPAECNAISGALTGFGSPARSLAEVATAGAVR
ncbi:MCE family protein [Rhodococcus sp. NPDC060086]|uniref:MCE family protein n=1 Tax=Rhodococcus sp. NPDC060086 TaxID=3347055 RepID=UPI00366663B3